MRREKFFTMLIAISLVMGIAFDWNKPTKTLVISEALILLLMIIKRFFRKEE